MPFLEHIISSIAPHLCLGCGAEGARLCTSCLHTLEDLAPTCYRCHTGGSWRVCANCRPKTSLCFVTAATAYAKHAKQVVHELKFERARAHAEVMAEAMAAPLHPMPLPDVISYVPTATSRIRLRGYDQARLIAKALAERLQAPCLPLFARIGQQRQVGQSQTVRSQQLEGAFYVVRPHCVINRRVLLIDDVITTGSTLEAAAKVLQEAGADMVGAAVFARGSLGLD